MKLTHLAGIAAVSAALLLTQAAPASAGSISSHSTMTSSPAAQAVRGHTVVPRTGGGCNADVCITVNGSGLYVNYVFTSAHNPNPYSVYTHPYITANGSTVKTGPSRTIAAGATSSYTWNAQRNFANGTVICAGWPGISGYPCATVHN
jgi:hypothetical protein